MPAIDPIPCRAFIGLNEADEFVGGGEGLGLGIADQSKSIISFSACASCCLARAPGGAINPPLVFEEDTPRDKAELVLDSIGGVTLVVGIVTGICCVGEWRPKRSLLLDLVKSFEGEFDEDLLEEAVVEEDLAVELEELAAEEEWELLCVDGRALFPPCDVFSDTCDENAELLLELLLLL